MDIITAAFEAGIVVRSFHADTGSLMNRWTCGINAEDFDGWRAEDTDRHRPPVHAESYRSQLSSPQAATIFQSSSEVEKKTGGVLGA